MIFKDLSNPNDNSFVLHVTCFHTLKIPFKAVALLLQCRIVCLFHTTSWKKCNKCFPFLVHPVHLLNYAFVFLYTPLYEISIILLYNLVLFARTMRPFSSFSMDQSQWKFSSINESFLITKNKHQSFSLHKQKFKLLFDNDYI